MALATFRFEFAAMGGGCELRLGTASEREARAAAEAAIAEVGRIERKYSRYRSDSLLSRINQGAGSGEWLWCDEETRWLLDYAETLFQVSEGYFDITAGVLRRAWDFSAAVVPTEEELARLRPLIGWRRVERDGERLRLPQAGMEIDFGGFGKEYAADCAAAALFRLGIEHGYVNLGGDLRVAGPQPDGRPWLIGIQDPRRPGAIVATLPLERGALATSGDYERFFERDGRRYCHLLNPFTGRPVDHWRSVSVMAPMAIAAGSYSTIAMLKEEGALALLDDSGFSYLAIDRQGALIQPPPAPT